jgi:hypothetical protein
MFFYYILKNVERDVVPSGKEELPELDEDGCFTCVNTNPNSRQRSGFCHKWLARGESHKHQVYDG